MKSIGHQLMAFVTGLALVIGLASCGGELSCEDANKAVESAELRYDEYDGDSLDVRRELDDKRDYARGDRRRACGGSW